MKVEVRVMYTPTPMMMKLLLECMYVCCMYIFIKIMHKRGRSDEKGRRKNKYIRSDVKQLIVIVLAEVMII